MKKQIVIIEGPSGVGKDTIVAALMALDKRLQKASSYTTRAMRPNEIDGVTYNFVDEETFKEKLQNGDIFEHTVRHGTYRGLSKTLIDKIIDNGQIALKDADIIGLNALKKVYPNRILTIFITADRNTIEKRLIARGDAPEDRKRRLDDYDFLMSHKVHFDFLVDNNGKLDEAVQKVHSIIIKHI